MHSGGSLGRSTGVPVKAIPTTIGATTLTNHLTGARAAIGTHAPTCPPGGSEASVGNTEPKRRALSHGVVVRYAKMVREIHQFVEGHASFPGKNSDAFWLELTEQQRVDARLALASLERNRPQGWVGLWTDGTLRARAKVLIPGMAEPVHFLAVVKNSCVAKDLLDDEHRREGMFELAARVVGAQSER